MTTTSGDIVLAGIGEVLVGTTLTTVTADFPAPRNGEDDSSLERGMARSLRVWALYDVPLADSSSGSYRRLGYEVGIAYPTDAVSQGVQLQDAPLFEARLRDLHIYLAALDTPVEPTRAPRQVPTLEGYGASFVRADFASGGRSLTAFRGAIEYQAR